eukprot:927502_1
MTQDNHNKTTAEPVASHHLQATYFNKAERENQITSQLHGQPVYYCATKRMAQDNHNKTAAEPVASHHLQATYFNKAERENQITSQLHGQPVYYCATKRMAQDNHNKTAAEPVASHHLQATYFNKALAERENQITSPRDAPDDKRNRLWICALFIFLLYWIIHFMIKTNA